MRKILLIVAIMAASLLSTLTSVKPVHATPPSPADCNGTWRGPHSLGAIWSDATGVKHFQTNTFVMWIGAPDNQGGCTIHYAWDEEAYQNRNGTLGAPDQFFKHHLRFRIWVCGTLVQDSSGDTPADYISGWYNTADHYYPAGCSPQFDNYGYTASTAGSYVGENWTGVTPVAYVNW